MEFVYMRAKKNTRYTTAGITYDLNIWYENGVMFVAFTDRLGEYQVLKYHTRNEFDEEWEEFMSDYPKYRLKKDTPNYEAGSIFVVTIDKDALVPHADNVVVDSDGEFYCHVSDIKHFDEWFEEVKEKPKWVRKQIKQALFDDNRLTDNEPVWVKMRFFKDFYFERSDIRGIKHYKTGYELEKVLFKDEREILLPRTICFINQLVRDGYIEIEDNPNIVWEDEND